MILLRPDCLVFKTSTGESFPCPVSEVVIEFIGDSARHVDEATIQNASAAVLHYFRSELGKTVVSIGEFSLALEHALRGLGFDVKSASADDDEQAVPLEAEADLRILAGETGSAFELIFFRRLRQELRRLLGGGPQTLRFHGLRECVKQITGARRWDNRCRELQEQIVDFLRRSFGREPGRQRCVLVVR